MRNLLILFTLLLVSCQSCGDDGGDDPDNPETPEPGPGQVVAYDLGEIDMASAAEDGALPRFEDPIPPEESRQLIEAFSWEQTEALPETDPDGRPSLFYTLIYLESRDQVKSLEQNPLPWDMLPMFGEERRPWAGKTGVFTFTGDGEGIFAFAVIPGVLYNTLRERALEGDPAFRAVILRDPPTEDVTNEDGSLDYEALAKRGFTYPTPATTTPPPNAFVPADFWRGSGEFAEDIGDEFRRVNERVAATFGKEGDFLIDLDILNTDVGFFNDDYDPPMLSGWRRGPGGSPKAIHPYGAKLRLQTDMLLRDTTINSRGRARLRAFKGARYNVCIEARNDAGVISEFLTPIIACHIGEHGEDDDWGEVPQVEAAAFYQKIVIRDYIINLLTQFTDSRDYMREVMGHEMRQTRVLIGPLADVFGSGASTICNGDESIDAAGALINLSALVPPVHVALSNDMLFRGSKDVGAGGKFSAVSRTIPTHEYGHFVFCELLKSADRHVFSSVWLGLLHEANFPGKVAGARGQETSEALADFFSWQVVGAVNYFGFHDDWGKDGLSSFYCDPLRATEERLAETGRTADEAEAACMEDNLGGPGQLDPDSEISGKQFNVNLARTVTILHDAFDGAPTYDGEPAAIPARQDGSWKFRDGVFYPEWVGGAPSSDEEVALPPRAYPRIFRNFVFAPNTQLNDRAFYDAIARVLRNYGYAADQVCEMFALHAPTGDCRELVSDAALGADDAVPYPPFDLRRTLTTSNDATWSWDDGSTFSTGYQWLLLGDDGDRREGTVAERTVSVDGLNSDTEYTFSVQTVNNAETSDPVEQTFVTYATPTTIETGTGEPGAASLTWADVDATSYTVEVEEPSGLRRIVGSTGDTTFRVTGLEGSTTYSFRVIAENRHGVQSEPSAPFDVTTEAVTTIYVATTGDDGATGTAGDPVASLSQALTLAGTRDAQAIELAAGVYNEPDALVIDRTLTISGPDTGDAQVWVAGLQTGARCGAADVNSEALPARAAVVAEPGVELYLRDLTLQATPASASDVCVHALDFAGSRLTTVNSTVGVAAVDVDCAAGIVARNSLSLIIEDSTVVGLEDGNGANANHEFVGACTENVPTIHVIDATVSAVGSFPTAAPTTLYGMAIDQAATVDVSRSFILANGDTAGADAGDAAAVAGLDVTATTRVFVHNSAVMTARGAQKNRAINIDAPFGSAADVFVYHTTATVGDDWGDFGAAPSAHEGSAIRLAGELGRLELINSLLSHAGGHGSSGWAAGLNVADLDTAVADFFINGNAFSVADRPPGEGKSAMVIRSYDPEFGFLTRGVNSDGTYTTAPCQSTSPRCVSDNLELYSRPVDTLDVGTHIAAVDLDGRPGPLMLGGTSYVVTFGRIIVGGVPLDSYPRGPLVLLDLGGTTRESDIANAIGPYELSN